MATDTPPICAGSGTLAAAVVAVDNCEPNTASTIPGAYTCWNEAPFFRPEIVGDPDATVTDTVAVPPKKAPSPLYCAVIELLPTVSCEPFTVMLAVAAPPEPPS